MLFNQAALINLIKENPTLWEVEFDGDIKKIKTIAPINPKHIVDEEVAQSALFFLFTSQIISMKIETYELTDKEATLAQCAGINFEYFYEETGYSNCDGDSCFLCFTLREALETTDFDKHQIAGLISSLDQKGVLYIEYRHPDGSEGPDLYYLSEDFINAVARKNIAEGKGRYCFA